MPEIISFITSEGINRENNQGKNKKNNMKSIDHLEEQEDEYLLALALEREKNGSGVTFSIEEIMVRHGIAQEDIDNAEEDEIG